MPPGNAAGTLAAVVARNAQTVIAAKAGIQFLPTPLPFHASGFPLAGLSIYPSAAFNSLPLGSIDIFGNNVPHLGLSLRKQLRKQLTDR